MIKNNIILALAFTLVIVINSPVHNQELYTLHEQSKGEMTLEYNVIHSQFGHYYDEYKVYTGNSIVTNKYPKLLFNPYKHEKNVARTLAGVEI